VLAVWLACTMGSELQRGAARACDPWGAVPPAVEHIYRAERLLDQGYPARALVAVNAFDKAVRPRPTRTSSGSPSRAEEAPEPPAPKKLTPCRGKPIWSLEEVRETYSPRALKIRAIATVRLGGRVNDARTRVRTKLSEAERIEHIRWAELTLRPNGDAPYEVEWHAEAMARSPEYRDQGIAELERLSQVSPYVYHASVFAVLADLRPTSEGRHEALRRCNELAGNAAVRICPRGEVGAAR
jgi:hypothetical protein